MCPGNAACTVREEFVEYHEDALLGDLHAFNDELFAYLERYNAERPHRSLENMTPCQALAKQLPHLSSMWWTHTVCFIYHHLVLKSMPLVPSESICKYN